MDVRSILALCALVCVPVATGVGVKCSRSLVGNSGVISSYNYPFDYRHNLSCTYRIVLGPPKGPRTVCFTFKRFALERSTPFCSFDYLRFNNMKYCGNGLWQYGRQTAEPESNVWNKHFCWPAKNNHFDVVFMSDNNLNGAGFYAEYHVLPGPPPNPAGDLPDIHHAPCLDSQWTCFNRRCINRTQLCDGKDDCGDTTDESYAHARCPDKSLLACDFSTDSVLSDGQCGFAQHDGQWFRTNMALSQGPPADHTNGTRGYYMYTDSDHSPAYLVSPEITLPAGVPHCLSFWYYVYGRPADATLSIFLGRVVDYSRPEWMRRHARPNTWLQGQVILEADQRLQVTFGAVLDNSFSGVALDDISVLPGVCTGGDISCSFESNLCGWSTESRVGDLHGNLTWQRNNRLQSDAGPLVDHSSTDGSGSYLLVRAYPNQPSPDTRALLVSPTVSVYGRSTRCLRFWYHMSGQGYESAVLRTRLLQANGQLTGARWSQNARFQNGWRQMALQIVEDQPFQVVIEAILDGATGQVALDEIVMEDNECPEVDSGACVGGEFLCGDGSCIPTVHKCDGITHCPDGSDEDWRAACPRTTTVLPSTVCPRDYFKCVSDGRCVPITWVCDNFRDCSDGSDESHEAKCEGVSPVPRDGSTTVSPCGRGQFACANGQCVAAAARCDGISHCGDSSDEGARGNCTTSNGAGTLTTRIPSCGKMFTCASGLECISRDLVCDGKAHCADGSDEDSSTAQCARAINTSGLGTSAAVGLALSLLVLLALIILPILLCRRHKARLRQRGINGGGSSRAGSGRRAGTPDTPTPDISTISYGDDASLSRPLEDSLRRWTGYGVDAANGSRGGSARGSSRSGRQRDGRLVNPVNELQQRVEQMDDNYRQSCIENLERYMINPRRVLPLPPLPNRREEPGRGEDLVNPSEYILALRAAPLHPPPYSIRDYQNLQYIPPDENTSGVDAPSSSGVYSLPPDEPPPPYDGSKNSPANPLGGIRGVRATLSSSQMPHTSSTIPMRIATPVGSISSTSNTNTQRRDTDGMDSINSASQYNRSSTPSETSNNGSSHLTSTRQASSPPSLNGSHHSSPLTSLQSSHQQEPLAASHLSSAPQTTQPHATSPVQTSPMSSFGLRSFGQPGYSAGQNERHNGARLYPAVSHLHQCDPAGNPGGISQQERTDLSGQQACPNQQHQRLTGHQGKVQPQSNYMPQHARLGRHEASSPMQQTEPSQPEVGSPTGEHTARRACQPGLLTQLNTSQSHVVGRNAHQPVRSQQQGYIALQPTAPSAHHTDPKEPSTSFTGYPKGRTITQSETPQSHVTLDHPTPNGTLPPSHQLHQVQLQFLPSSSV